MHSTYAAHLILLDLIILNHIEQKAQVNGTVHDTVYYNLLVFHPSLVKIFSVAPCMQIVAICVLPLISGMECHTQMKQGKCIIFIA
jgi:hypothetical protein